jgi:hypothetical protein
MHQTIAQPKASKYFPFPFSLFSPVQVMKKKLSLNKKAVTKLSNDQMNVVVGGQQEQFISIFRCSVGGFTCADTCTSHASDHCG